MIENVNGPGLATVGPPLSNPLGPEIFHNSRSSSIIKVEKYTSQCCTCMYHMHNDQATISYNNHTMEVLLYCNRHNYITSYI